MALRAGQPLRRLRPKQQIASNFKVMTEPRSGSVDRWPEQKHFSLDGPWHRARSEFSPTRRDSRSAECANRNTVLTAESAHDGRALVVRSAVTS
jgi:hypothetical protein